MTSQESKETHSEFDSTVTIEKKLLAKYTSHCPSSDTKSIADHLSEIKFSVLAKDVTQNFTDPNVLKAAICITEIILLDNNSGMERSHTAISDYITNLKQIGKFKDVMSADLKDDGKKFFIVKQPYENNANAIIHEAAIAILAANQFRMYNIPNFALVYGIFYCSPSPGINSVIVVKMVPYHISYMKIFQVKH